MNEETILIVDDESSIREMLRMVLDIAGFNYLEADNIHDAYTIVIDQAPSLILLDWMLPGGSGIELLHRLKRQEHTRDLPVIMLTAKTSEDNIVQGLDVGADDYISKPFAPRELVARIKSLLRRNAKGEQAQSLQMAESETSLIHFAMSRPISLGLFALCIFTLFGAIYVERKTRQAKAFAKGINNEGPTACTCKISQPILLAFITAKNV